MAQKDVETEIQQIIASVKQEKENENINSVETETIVATIEDLKNRLDELGYNLDTSTGQVIYNNYIVTISPELTISSIEGIETVTIGETQYDCKNRKKVAFDRDVMDNELLEVNVKAKNEQKGQIYRLIPKPEISVVNYDVTGDGSTRKIK